MTTADSMHHNGHINAPRRRPPRIVRALPQDRYYQDTDGCWYLDPRAEGSHCRPNGNRALRFAMLAALAKRYGRTGFLFEGARRNA